MTTAEVPKKFYRHVMKGVAYYSNELDRPCTLQDLVAFVYLKNSRALSVARVEEITRQVLPRLSANRLIKGSRNSYRLNELLLSAAGSSGRGGGAPREEAVAGPSSGTTTNRVNRRQRQRRSTPMRQMEEEIENPEEESSEPLEDFPHRPIKIEAEEVPQVQPAARIRSQTSAGVPDQDISPQVSSTEGQQAASEEAPENASQWFSWFLW